MKIINHIISIFETDKSKIKFNKNLRTIESQLINIIFLLGKNCDYGKNTLNIEYINSCYTLLKAEISKDIVLYEHRTKDQYSHLEKRVSYYLGYKGELVFKKEYDKSSYFNKRKVVHRITPELAEIIVENLKKLGIIN